MNPYQCIWSPIICYFTHHY